LVGTAVECKSRVTQQIERLHTAPHRPELQLAVLDLALDAADPRRPVRAHGCDRAVPVCLEALADARGELRHLGLERAPGRHGAQLRWAAAGPTTGAPAGAPRRSAAPRRPVSGARRSAGPPAAARP